MKRKLFLMLAAFMALVGFQANAQTKPYDGSTLFFLNVWSANQEAAYPGHFWDNYGVTGVLENAKDYPLSADKVATGKNIESFKYVVDRPANTWEVKNSGHKGKVGENQAYFTIVAEGGSSSNTYTIKSKAPEADGEVIFFNKDRSYGTRNANAVTKFQFVRFVTEGGLEYDGLHNAVGNLDSVGMVPFSVKQSKPQEGGYLIGAENVSSFSGRNSGGVNDRNLWVVAYDTTPNINGAPNNRYAIYSMDEVRKNWASYYANKSSVTRIVPVWVKADPIGGRWATANDFTNEFINFINQTTKTALTVDGVNVFNVILSDTLKFGTNGSDNTKTYSTSGTAHAATLGDNPSNVATGDTSRLFKANGIWNLQTFIMMDPCSQKLLSVKKEQVPGTVLINGVAAFGDKLEMKAAYTAGTSTETLQDLQRIQRFAVWINENGDMELYPLNSWNYDTSNKSYNTNPTTPHYNFAVWNDRPYATVVDSEVDGFNRSIKIGQMSGTPCTGTVSGTYTGYSSLPLRPLKAELINQITEKRYYFIEVTPQNVLNAYTGAGVSTAMRDSFYVLDMVTVPGSLNPATNKPYKRLVVTAKEKNRYQGTTPRYFDTPYDSVNMSAHWQFVRVAGGYNIINELGDTLEYSYQNGTPAAQSTGERSYLLDRPIYKAGSYKSDVWQSVHLNCFNGMFKLRNMAESPMSPDSVGYERPALKYAYVDTVAYTRTGTFETNPYWYMGQRGRQATGVATYNYVNHLQKDARLDSIGMLFKLTPIDYEYAPGGSSDTRTNHSDDLYSPADDSLCTYLFKEGHYDIREALSNALRVENGYAGPDPVYGKNLAYFTRDNSSTPWLWVEPVISSTNPDLDTYKYITPMTYVDGSSTTQLNVDYSLTGAQMQAVRANANPIVINMLQTEGFNVDSYKWHYVRNNDNEYLVYDTINTQTTFPQQQFGFKFAKVDRTNATMFRFYQPLVGDKHLEYFIMEFRVAKHDYVVNRANNVAPYTPYAKVVLGWNNIYSTDNYGINPAMAPVVTSTDITQAPNVSPGNPLLAGYTSKGGTAYTYATLATYVNSNPNMSLWTSDAIEAYLAYLNYERQVRTKYAIITSGSDMMLSTWNDGRNKTTGAPDAATRFKFTGPDVTQCARDYVDSKYLIDNQMYSVPLTVQEFDPMTETLMNMYMQMGSTKYAENAANPLNLIFTLADTLKVNTTLGVGHGYLKRTVGATGSDMANDRYREYNNTKDVELYYVQNPLNPKLFLTIDSTSVYGQTIPSAIPGVSGVQLRWDTLYTATSNKYSSVHENADYRPLQMFAIYGCKSTQPSTYGSFMFIPAASWVVNYDRPFNQVLIKQNANIGNGPVSDEFRVAEYSKAGGIQGRLVVMPSSSEKVTEGVSATEYMFNRSEYYSGDFCEHNFIQDDAGKYYASWKSGVVTKSYYDATHHWNVTKVKGYNNLYEFTPEGAEFDENGQKVPARNQLLGQFYLYQMSKTTTPYGGAVQKFLAIPRYYDIQLLQLKTITITCITDKDPGQPGDNCMIKYKKFTNEDLTYDWAMLETVYADRYIYSRGKADGSGYVGGIAKAYEESVNNAGGVQYLRIRESNFVVDPGHENDSHFHHGVPYYNIIHVVVDPATKIEKEYYLQLTTDGRATFKYIAPDSREKYVLTHYDEFAADTLQSFKFCFPFKNVGDSTTTKDGKYKDANIGVRTMPYHNEIMWLAIDQNATSEVYGDPNSGGTFFFGPKADTGEEWVGPTDKSGWLKDFSRTDPYLVDASDLSPVNYGLLSYVDAINPIDHAKLTFKLVYDTIVNKYSKEKIWYYNIINSKGKYLTMVNTKADSANANYNYGSYTYAYFTDPITTKDSHGADAKYAQTFGLQKNKSAITAGHAYPFWIVAQVPTGQYKYLAQWNNRLVFVNTFGSTRALAQQQAMTFEIGKVNGKTFTDVPTINGAGVAVYGLDGAVKVVNATGVIEIYTVDGRMVKSVAAVGTEQTIAAPRGLVIVKNGANVAKVVVK